MRNGVKESRAWKSTVWFAEEPVDTRRDVLTAFLLELSDALGPLSNPTDIQETVTRIGRDFFEADRCYYCEIVDDDAIIRRDASREGLPSVAGVYSLRNFPILKAVIDASRPFVVHDVQTTNLVDENLRALCMQLQVISFLDVPVIKAGKPVGVLCITQNTPRSWTESEIALAIEVADRTWAAVERVRAEVALQRSEARLREANERKDEFLAMLGHELRNPLAAIRNATELMKMVAPADHRLQQVHKILDRQTTHISRLVDGLLEIARIARGKVVLERQTCDAREILLGVLENWRTQILARGLEPVQDVPSEPVWIYADPVRVAQVLDNLVGNALKFTPSGRIEVTLQEECGTVVFRIRDTGIGIRPEAIANLFEPFQQEHQELARSAGGLGLGLAVAKGLVELHGGTIEARSEGLGTGTEVRVRLSPAPRPASVPDPEMRIAGACRRILIVEDNVDAGQSLRDLLELLGHDVELVDSGPKALEVLSKWRADLVLCDIGLPGMSGYEVARVARKNPSLSNTRLVAMTGYGLPEDVRKTKEAGFDEHLVKPVEVQKLSEILRGV